MSYDLYGRRLLILINVKKYHEAYADRDGSEIDVENIIKTFKERVAQGLNLRHYHTRLLRLFHCQAKKNYQVASFGMTICGSWD